ncbi:MFS transporter [Anaerocolumna sp. AGMB13025]|uniref:MFS transporter n=1 Tax=Anaerocolumna sp. AGMB13025 TaxID=3039116 RepID=UPI00241D7399|nr:MFS transporter [Anaerocolumna sp. AGMB13025]WFR55879.1 MFS transporter [Anaerocolumna sp. AGMB13025]
MAKISQIIILMNNFSLGIILPVLNLILLERGASLKTLPILIALYAITVLCVELPSGICADLFGRKNVFLISCIFQFLSMVLLLLSNNMIWLIFVIICNGLSRSFASGSLDALIIDQALVSKGEDFLSKVTSRLAILEGIGLAVGGIAGGVISYLSGNYTMNIILRAGLTIVVLVLCVLFIKEIQKEKETERIPLTEHIRLGKEIVFSTPNFKLIFAGVFFLGFFLITIETYWQPAFTQIAGLTGSVWLLGIITFFGFVASVSGNTAAHKLLQQFNNHKWKVYNINRIVLGICIVIFALQSSSAGYILGYAVIYFVLGVGNVAENTLINQYTPSSMRASVLSLSSLITQIGVMVSSLFSSIMISYLQIKGIWIVTGLLLAGYALFVTVITYKKSALEAES